MPTQTTDIVSDPNGIVYTAPGETWVVAKGVSVFGNDVGVLSEFVDSTLKNKGSITGNGAGVVFDGGAAIGDYYIKNNGKGSIHGGEAGVAFVDFTGMATLDNKGSVSGLLFGTYIAAETVDASVMNKGTISGGAFGLGVNAGTGSSAAVENHGMIESGQIGVAFMADDYYGAFLRNHKDGEISGFGAAVASEARLQFINQGKVDGTVRASDYDDKVINKGKIKGDVALGDGIDIFKNKGTGKSGLIDSGEGNDLVVLGKKVDKLLFASDLDALTNVDTIKKFESGHDKIYLNADIFTEIALGTLAPSQFHKGTSAADADDRIIYDKATGALYYDADGTGAAAQVQFADLGAGTKLKASDINVGFESVDGFFLMT